MTIVKKHFPVNSVLWRIIRQSWQGGFDQHEFIKVLGFGKLNPLSLIHAAGLNSETETVDAALLERAIENLGVRYAAVVVAIAYTCHLALYTKPPPVWKKLLLELMTNVEIGYRLGSRVLNLGVEGGALAGFARGVGPLGLLMNNPAAFKKWYLAPPSSKVPYPIEVFGCEPYQVAAFAIQQLGFGHEVAIGTALGVGNLKNPLVKLDERSRLWQGAYLWVQALRDGRNYPADIEVRKLFPEVTPPTTAQGGKNLALEVLYTEISKVRNEGSSWTWHLPKSSYERTCEHLNLS